MRNSAEISSDHPASEAAIIPDGSDSVASAAAAAAASTSPVQSGARLAAQVVDR